MTTKLGVPALPGPDNGGTYQSNAHSAHIVQTAINCPTALPFLAAYGRLKHRLKARP